MENRIRIAVPLVIIVLAVRVQAQEPKRTLNSDDVRKPVAMAFDPSGRTLIVGRDASGKHGVVEVWNIATGKKASAFETGQGAEWVRLSSDGKLCVTAGRQSVHVWDIVTQKELPGQVYKGAVREMALAPDGSLLAILNEKHEVVVWDLAKKEQRAILKGTTPIVGPLCFSPKGGNLATVGRKTHEPGRMDSSEVLIWDLKTEKSRDLGSVGLVTEINFNATGELLGVGANVWNVKKGKLLTTIRRFGGLTRVFFAPAEEQLGTVFHIGNQYHLEIHATVEEPGWHLRAPGGPIESIAFSKAGKLVAVGRSGDPGNITIWDWPPTK